VGGVTPSEAPIFDFRAILCGPGNAGDGDGALSHALKIALAGNCELMLVRPAGETDASSQKALRDRLSRWLHARQAPRTSWLNVEGDPAQGFAQLVRTQRPDLLILGATVDAAGGRAVDPGLAAALAQVPATPTLYVPLGATGLVASATGELRLHRVLIPVGVSPDPSAAVELAQHLAASVGASQLHYMTLHVGKGSEVPTLVRMRDDARWEHRNRGGNVVVDAIVEEADTFGADLIAMSTSAWRASRRQLFGDTISQVMHRVGCPILIAPVVP